MSSPGWDLQKSVYATLAATPALIALLGGEERLYDSVPQNAAFPYIVLDQMQVRDWSTGTEKGAEHTLLLHIWSRHEGRQEVYEIADALRGVLDDRELTLDSHQLVNLSHQYSDLKRDEDSRSYHGVVRFRAITEPQI